MKKHIRALAQIIGLCVGLVLAGIASAYAQAMQPLPFSYISTNSTNSTLVSGSGQNILKWLLATNPTGSIVYYLKLYNKATAPTCGTDTPVMRIPLLPPSTGNGQTAMSFDETKFTAGIGFCITLNLADSDTNAAAAGLTINLGYSWQ